MVFLPLLAILIAIAHGFSDIGIKVFFSFNYIDVIGISLTALLLYSQDPSRRGAVC
jgi:hypothetical protein